MTVNPLHMALANRIAHLIHEDATQPGSHLNENRLAERLDVSRTPIRAALDYLATQGFVTREANRGMVLIAKPPPTTAGAPSIEDDALPLRIARDRRQHQPSDYVSEQDLMKRYELPRPIIKRALERLSELGVVERKLGYGWRFPADAWDASIREESYLFRMTVEPAAMREPSFVLSADWARAMRLRHEAFLDMPWTEASSIAFFETNAAFHEGLAAASGDRFFVTAIQRQNRLRRLSNYDWRHGRERVKVNCHEHLEILARLQSGDNELAALLMHRHLESARTLRASAALA